MTAPTETGRPGSEPPECAAVKFFLFGKQARKRAAGLADVEAAAQLVGILRHEMSSAPL